MAESQTREEWMADLEEKLVNLEEETRDMQKKIERVRTIKAGSTRSLKIKLFFGLIEIER